MTIAFLLSMTIWGFALASAGYAALAVWLIHRDGWAAPTPQKMLTIALMVTAIWALTIVITPMGSPLSSLAELARNGVWLAFMAVLLYGNGRASMERGRGGAAGYIYTVLFVVLAFKAVLVVAAPGELLTQSHAMLQLRSVHWLLAMIFAVGALMLVHDLYTSFDADARWGVSLPLAGLAALWGYDLNLYTIAYLSQNIAPELLAAQGFALSALVVVFALGTNRNRKWRVRLSRQAAFQSASLIVIGGYLLVMLLASLLINWIGGDYARLAQISLIFVMFVGALLIMPSGKFRAWMRVFLAKNFYQHRYDYRDEWMRFTDTISHRAVEGEAGLLEMRVIKAVADICDSPAGLLLVPDNIGRLRIGARWNWGKEDLPVRLLSDDTLASFAATGFIIDLDDVRGEKGAPKGFDGLPNWVLQDARAWVMMPFLHFGSLVGLAILARPRIARALDWEDLEMLRVAGAQAASYLAEARGQEALAESQRFDEFNRRFAFIMHDIKNLVSQLSLLTRNAERHADNPEFRADMIDTLRASVGKMNDMLARLSQHHKGKASAPSLQSLAPIIEDAVREKSRLHPITIAAPRRVEGFVDAGRVGGILAHLLQNAIDASAPDAPIEVRLGTRGDQATVAVIDHGKGISEEFLRENLFKPFNSTKDGGFGIGAYEAQMLAQQMGGRIEVESTEGVGSVFTLLLPLADPKAHDTTIIKDEAA